MDGGNGFGDSHWQRYGSEEAENEDAKRRERTAGGGESDREVKANKRREVGREKDGREGG